MKLRALSLSKKPDVDFFDFTFRRGVLTASGLQKIFFFWPGSVRKINHSRKVYELYHVP